MKPLRIARKMRVSILALVTALCVAPSLSYARGFGSAQADVRFIGEPASFGPQLVDPLDAIKLGDLKRGARTLSVTLAPHGSVVAMADGEQRSGGALLRFEATGGRPEAGSWFLFAGAKGEAISWDMNSMPVDLGEFVQLKERQTVGDFQMGLGYQLGGAQVSLGLKRQTYKIDTNTRSLGDWKTRQTSIGVSLAWRP